ncbi:hypothetical protein IC582_028605 [Cucumis melo]
MSFVAIHFVWGERGQLRGTNNVGVEEMITIFLYILLHHVKNRVFS